MEAREQKTAPVPADIIEEARRRYLAGDSLRAIAKALPVSAVTLGKYCKAQAWDAQKRALAVERINCEIIEQAADAVQAVDAAWSDRVGAVCDRSLSFLDRISARLSSTGADDLTLGEIMASMKVLADSIGKLREIAEASKGAGQVLQVTIRTSKEAIEPWNKGLLEGPGAQSE